MDSEEDPTTYLKLFNDSSGSYLLQSSEELYDNFPVEPILTEIDASDWPSNGLPILLNESLISEDKSEDIENIEDNIQLNHTEEQSGEVLISEEDNGIGQNLSLETNNVCMLSKSQNGYIPIDFLSQPNLQDSNESKSINHNDKQQILSGKTILVHANGTLYSITYVPPQKESEKIVNQSQDQIITESEMNQPTTNNEVMQLLNMDETLTDVDTTTLKSLENLEEAIDDTEKLYNEFFIEVTANKCKVCSFLCENLNDMLDHLNNVHSELVKSNNEKTASGVKMRSILNNSNIPKDKHTMFVCSKCFNMFSSKDSLKNHMILSHGLSSEPLSKERKFINNDVKTEMNTNTENKNKKVTLKTISTELIRKQKNAMKKVGCSIKGCNLKFAKDELRLKHEECHVDENVKQFQCLVCKEKFSIWRICIKHVWQRHQIDLGLITCPMCNTFKSNSAVVVINHMNIHNQEKPFLCSDCGKSFKQYAQLRNHAVLHKKTDEMPNWSTAKQCNICDIYLANAKCLKKHIQSVHDKFKPFICNICGHQTTRKAMLELHLRQHTGDKPHQCSFCDYKTGDHNCLRRHLMRHVGGFKYFCPYCDYQSIQSASYKGHLEKKHPGKQGSFQCTQCNYRSVNSLSYMAHMKYHELATSKDNNGDSNDTSKQKAEPFTPPCVLMNVKNGPGVADGSQNFLVFVSQREPVEDIVDKGGITIPAGLEVQMVS